MQGPLFERIPTAIERVVERKWLKTENFVSMGDIVFFYRDPRALPTALSAETILSALRINEMHTETSSPEAASFWKSVPEFLGRFEYKGVVSEIQAPEERSKPPPDGFRHRIIGVSKEESACKLNGRWFPRAGTRWQIGTALVLDFEILDGSIRCFVTCSNDKKKSCHAIPLGLLLDQTGDGVLYVRMVAKFD